MMSEEPPPYTEVCNNQPFRPPNYFESVTNSAPDVCRVHSSGEPSRKFEEQGGSRAPEIGWTQSQQAHVVTVEPQSNITSSVVYVTQNPRGLMQDVGLPGGLITCPSCRELSSTRIVHSPGCQTHMWACILLICGCWPCCFVPYCCPACLDTDIHCDNCGANIATVM